MPISRRSAGRKVLDRGHGLRMGLTRMFSDVVAASAATNDVIRLKERELEGFEPPLLADSVRMPRSNVGSRSVAIVGLQWPHCQVRMRAMPLDENWFENERLHHAAAEGDLSEMRRLLICGFQLNVFDDLSYAPLHYAVKGEHYKRRSGCSIKALMSTHTTKNWLAKRR